MPLDPVAWASRAFIAAFRMRVRVKDYKPIAERELIGVEVELARAWMHALMAADLSMLLPQSLRASKERTTVQASDGVTKPPRRLQRLPPISGGAKADRSKANATAGADPAARAAKAWMRQALAKRVATRMLKRSTAPPSLADEVSGGGGGRKVLACCCARLPPGGLRCALHQAGAPGRAWMLRAQAQQQRRGCGDVERDAVAPPRAHGWAFSEYARWRRHVWMPSRFYLERVEERAIDLTSLR